MLWVVLRPRLWPLRQLTVQESLQWAAWAPTAWLLLARFIEMALVRERAARSGTLQEGQVVWPVLVLLP